jgi:hypothetical protein
VGPVFPVLQHGKGELKKKVFNFCASMGSSNVLAADYFFKMCSTRLYFSFFKYYSSTPRNGLGIAANLAG